MKEKDQLNEEMNEKLATSKKENDRVVEEYKSKLLMGDESLKELQRQKIQVESEFE